MTVPWKKILCRLCVGIVVVEVALAYPLGYDFVLNSLGPSTEYLDPSLPTATMVDGKPTVYAGDDFYVQHTIVRHAINGNCILRIHRYAEDVDGPTGAPRGSGSDPRPSTKDPILRHHMGSLRRTSATPYQQAHFFARTILRGRMSSPSVSISYCITCS
jgi:hypothetical protein